MKKLLAVLFVAYLRDIRDRIVVTTAEAKVPAFHLHQSCSVICCPRHPAGISVGGYCNW